jgi:hypothetical protein
MGNAPQHGIQGKGRNLARRTCAGKEIARFSAVISYGRIAIEHLRIKMGATRAVPKNRNYKWLAGASIFSIEAYRESHQ